MKKLLLFLVVSIFLFGSSKGQNNTIKSPESFFGFQPGTDRMLFDYEELIKYFKHVDELSARVKLIEIGESPMGKTMYMALVSSEENIANLDRLKEINRELALNSELNEEQQKQFMSEGRVFVLAALSMHASEVGPAQASPLEIYEMATTQNSDLLTWMNDVVYMIIPSHNPDGMDMIVHFYNETKGTKYEGGNLPDVYHKYVGHDNNRDFVTLTQSDNLAVARIYNKSWYPQVLVEKHQMGSYGPRYFVPPMHDPVAENIDEKIWNWTWIFGSNMAKDMAADGLAGVSQHYLFDDYWPGSTETSNWKNVISLLTECASVQYAKPIYIEKNELRATGKGLGEYKKSINMPLVWEGGWWRLSDIVDYELSSTWSIIKTASFHKKDILKNRNELCKEEVQKGKQWAPSYYVLPKKQHDESELLTLITLLDEHGVSVYTTQKRMEYNAKIIEKGDYIVPLSQPFRAFIKEVMEVQKFPERHYTPGGEMIEPYDITSWSLPLHRGVKTWQINQVNNEIEQVLLKVDFPLALNGEHSENVKTLIFPVSNNESYKVAFRALANNLNVNRATKNFQVNGIKINEGDFVFQFSKKNTPKLHSLFAEIMVAPITLTEEISENLEEMTMPRIALIETNFHDMDAGWTRYIFDKYYIPFTSVKPGEVKEKKWSEFDVIVFPDTDKSVLLEGKYKASGGTYNVPNLDPKFSKGIGKEGLQELMKFVNNGGKIISWGESAGLFLGMQTIKLSETEKEEFQLPVNDVSEAIKQKGLYAPGTLLHVDLVENHPLTLGMPEKACVFSRGRPVFSTSIPYFDTDRRVIATFPDENVLASGYAKNHELLEGKSAMVWAKKGKGQFIFYGFYPQFRASTSGTYKLLFNALLLK